MRHSIKKNLSIDNQKGGELQAKYIYLLFKKTGETFPTNYNDVNGLLDLFKNKHGGDFIGHTVKINENLFTMNLINGKATLENDGTNVYEKIKNDMKNEKFFTNTNEILKKIFDYNVSGGFKAETIKKKLLNPGGRSRNYTNINLDEKLETNIRNLLNDTLNKKCFVSKIFQIKPDISEYQKFHDSNTLNLNDDKATFIEIDFKDITNNNEIENFYEENKDRDIEKIVEYLFTQLVVYNDKIKTKTIEIIKFFLNKIFINIDKLKKDDLKNLKKCIDKQFEYFNNNLDTSKQIKKYKYDNKYNSKLSVITKIPFDYYPPELKNINNFYKINEDLKTMVEYLFDEKIYYTNTAHTADAKSKIENNLIDFLKSFETIDTEKTENIKELKKYIDEKFRKFNSDDFLDIDKQIKNNNEKSINHMPFDYYPHTLRDIKKFYKINEDLKTMVNYLFLDKIYKYGAKASSVFTKTKKILSKKYQQDIKDFIQLFFNGDGKVIIESSETSELKKNFDDVFESNKTAPYFNEYIKESIIECSHNKENDKISFKLYPDAVQKEYLKFYPIIKNITHAVEFLYTYEKNCKDFLTKLQPLLRHISNNIANDEDTQREKDNLKEIYKKIKNMYTCKLEHFKDAGFDLELLNKIGFNLILNKRQIGDEIEKEKFRKNIKQIYESKYKDDLKQFIEKQENNNFFTINNLKTNLELEDELITNITRLAYGSNSDRAYQVKNFIGNKGTKQEAAKPRYKIRDPDSSNEYVILDIDGRELLSPINNILNNDGNDKINVTFTSYDNIQIKIKFDDIKPDYQANKIKLVGFKKKFPIINGKLYDNFSEDTNENIPQYIKYLPIQNNNDIFFYIQLPTNDKYYKTESGDSEHVYINKFHNTYSNLGVKKVTIPSSEMYNGKEITFTADGKNRRVKLTDTKLIELYKVEGESNKYNIFYDKGEFINDKGELENYSKIADSEQTLDSAINNLLNKNISTTKSGNKKKNLNSGLQSFLIKFKDIYTKFISTKSNKNLCKKLIEKNYNKIYYDVKNSDPIISGTEAPSTAKTAATAIDAAGAVTGGTIDVDAGSESEADLAATTDVNAGSVTNTEEINTTNDTNDSNKQNIPLKMYVKANFSLNELMEMGLKDEIDSAMRYAESNSDSKQLSEKLEEIFDSGYSINTIVSHKYFKDLTKKQLTDLNLPVNLIKKLKSDYLETAVTNKGYRHTTSLEIPDPNFIINDEDSGKKYFVALIDDLDYTIEKTDDMNKDSTDYKYTYTSYGIHDIKIKIMSKNPYKPDNTDITSVKLLGEKDNDYKIHKNDNNDRFIKYYPLPLYKDKFHFLKLPNDDQYYYNTEKKTYKVHNINENLKFIKIKIPETISYNYEPNGPNIPSQIIGYKNDKIEGSIIKKYIENEDKIRTFTVPNLNKLELMKVEDEGKEDTYIFEYDKSDEKNVEVINKKSTGRLEKKRQRKEAGKLFFEDLINYHTLLYGTDFDDKEKAKDEIKYNKPRNQQIILFLDNFKIKDKLAKEYMDTQTGYFKVFNSDIFDLKKELEFLELNKLKKMEKEIEKLQKEEDMDAITAKIDDISNYLNILDKKQKERNTSEDVKIILEKQREILKNDPKLKEAMKIRLQEKINTQKFDSAMKEKMMGIAKQEGYIIAIESLIERAEEEASQDIAIQRSESNKDLIESDADYKANKQKLIELLASNEIDFKENIENKLTSNPQILEQQIQLINELKNKQYELNDAKAAADEAADEAAAKAAEEAAAAAKAAEEAAAAKAAEEAAAAKAAEEAAAAKAAEEEVEEEAKKVMNALKDEIITSYNISKFPEFDIFKKNFIYNKNNTTDIYIAYIETLNNLTKKLNTQSAQSGGSNYISDNESISDNDDYIGGINNTYQLIGGAKPHLEVDKNEGNMGNYLYSAVTGKDYKQRNFTEENFYNLTHYYIELTWPIYVILKMFIKKNSLIKSFMNNYINKIFGLTNNKKLNAIKSSPDAYRSISNILINQVFFDIIQNNISDIKNYKDKDYEEIENELIEILENENETIEKLDKKNTAFMKLSFNQSELIKYLVDSFDNIAKLGKLVNKEGGIEKIRTMYSEKIKKILNIIESEEDVREKFNYITDDLNSIFNLQGTNILKPYRDTIKKIDKAIDDFDGPANSVLIEELLRSHLKGFKLESNKITIDLDDIEFNDTLEGKQLQAIQEKIKQRQEELDNLKKLVQQTGNSIQEEE